jgi:hypothetical protein
MQIPDIRPIPDIQVIPDILDCHASKFLILASDRKLEILDRVAIDKKTFEDCVKELSSYKLATFIKANKTTD